VSCSFCDLEAISSSWGQSSGGIESDVVEIHSAPNARDS